MEPENHRLLDLFLFRPETDIRFDFLIITSILICWSMGIAIQWGVIYFQLSSGNLDISHDVDISNDEYIILQNENLIHRSRIISFDQNRD